MFTASYFPKQYFTGAYWPPREGIVIPLPATRACIMLSERRAYRAQVSERDAITITTAERRAYHASVSERSC